MFNKREISYNEFEEICERISYILKKYFGEDIGNHFINKESDYEMKKLRLDKQSSMLFLSNGDKVKCVIPKSAVPHLLGVDTNYLSSTRLFKSIDSFGILTEFLDNSYSFYQKHQQGIINLANVFSSYVFEKIEAFSRNVSIDVNNIEFICKYDKDKKYSVLNSESINFNANIDYLILSKYGDKYYVLMLSELNGELIPQSNQVFNSYKEVKNKLASMLCNQELTLIKGKNIFLGYDNNPKKFRILSSDLEKKYSVLNSWSKTLNCIPNVLDDLLYYVGANKNKEETIMQISECISKGKIVDMDTSRLPLSYVDLIRSYNNSLIKDDKNIDVVVSQALISENNNLQKRLENALKQIEQLNSELYSLKEDYKDLEIAKKERDKQISDIAQVLNRTSK